MSASQDDYDESGINGVKLSSARVGQSTNVLFWFGERLITCLVGFSIIILTKLFCRLEVTGRENIPHNGRILVLSQHRSSFGIFLIEQLLIFPWVLRNMKMFPYNVGKQKHIKAAGNFLRSVAGYFNVIELPDKNNHLARRQIVQTQIKILSCNADVLMVLFPTGTRDEPDQLGLPPFLAGVGRVVTEAKPKVIFVWDDDTAIFWPKGKIFPTLPFWLWHGIPLPCRYLVRINISRPIDASDLTTGLGKLCHNVEPEESGRPVADYLHDLCWSWASFVCFAPDDAGLNKGLSISGDLARII